MKENRKYLGVPTQEEIIQQYSEITEMTKNIRTVAEVLEFQQTNPNDGYPIDVEINYNAMSAYTNEPIEVIRYAYKNILVYADIKDGGVQHRRQITVYDDDGDIQFGDEVYNDYEQEIDRVASMGLLRRNNRGLAK